MEQNIKALQNYLNTTHSCYHAIKGLTDQLLEGGYMPLSESSSWDLVPGGKYYITRGGSSLLAFRIPVAVPTGFMMTAGHCDFPGFKLKENTLSGDKYTRLAVERYGGCLIAPWLDRPLSVAGRVTVEKNGSLQTKLVDIDRDLVLIPNVAIHMNKGANDGYKWDLNSDVLPLAGSAGLGDKFKALLEEAAGGKIVGHDLYLYVRDEARVWGLEEEYISAQAVDDVACVWGCAQGFLQARESEAINMLCVFDGEEVGSMTGQGAGSKLLSTTITRICKALQMDMDQLLAQSVMVSADNAHALHPNHPEFSDAGNAPVLGGGPVIKFNANMRYTTDGVGAAVMRQFAHAAGVPLQSYCNRADTPGGSTLGNISLGQVSVLSVDMGLPQLAMHSCYETAGVKDVDYMVDAMTAYYETTLEMGADGAVCLK